jgi:hypothetical protein
VLKKAYAVVVTRSDTALVIRARRLDAGLRVGEVVDVDGHRMVHNIAVFHRLEVVRVPSLTRAFLAACAVLHVSDKHLFLARAALPIVRHVAI